MSIKKILCKFAFIYALCLMPYALIAADRTPNEMLELGLRSNDKSAVKKAIEAGAGEMANTLLKSEIENPGSSAKKIKLMMDSGAFFSWDYNPTKPLLRSFCGNSNYSLTDFDASKISLKDKDGDFLKTDQEKLLWRFRDQFDWPDMKERMIMTDNELVINCYFDVIQKFTVNYKDALADALQGARKEKVENLTRIAKERLGKLESGDTE